jgi:hypothetical protein
MSQIPRQITIIGHPTSNNDFTVIALQWSGEMEICDHLQYDEMLGTIARVCCPVHGDGTPWRKIGPPLFLTTPNKTP